MELALVILPLVAKYGPEFVQGIIALCHRDPASPPTAAEWNAAFSLAKNQIADVSDIPVTVANR